MTARIEVWREGEHAGQFIFNDRHVSFRYADDASPTPISLSLPREGRANRLAAQHFLENLLPENPRTRQRMANVYGAKTTSAFDLLNVAGGDIAGGLVLLPEGEAPSVSPAELSPALVRDVAERIAAIKRDASETVPSYVPARFSLSGAQAKFALASIDGDWYWSNASVPSTYIVKPGDPQHRGIEAAEAAAMWLAHSAWIPIPLGAEVMTFGDQTAYVVTRFDRTDIDGPGTRRVHAEDLAQSLGVSAEKKYEVSVTQITALLAPFDEDGSIRRAFIEQLAFNVIIGNADAHAKNYSVMLRPNSIALSPMYDVVPIFLYPTYDQTLAMKVGNARHPREVTPNHWVRLAGKIGFDGDEVLKIVRDIASRVGEHNDGAWDDLDADQAAKAREYVAHSVDVTLSTPRSHLTQTGPIDLP